MPLIFAAALAAAQPTAERPQPTLGRTAWIFATIGHSEFCPPGNVRVDLRSGRYELTVRAPRRICDEPGLERPVQKGKLTGDGLARLRSAYLRVLAEGLADPNCHKPNGPGPYQIILTNAGTPIMVVATGRSIGSAPDDLNCWNRAATTLHDVLDDVFGTRNWRYI
jgi:hypothetical protein